MNTINPATAGGKTRPRCCGAKAYALDGLQHREIKVSGQTKRALVALVKAGPAGCTAAEVSSWALRFAAYCFNLRHDWSLEIVTLRERHPGGWHGRHVPLTPVLIEGA